MIRHILLFSFRTDVEDRARQTVLDGLRQLPRWFPQMRNFELGSNQSRRDDTYQFGMTISFDSFDDLDAYLNSTRHEDFVANCFRPAISSRAVVSFEA